MVGVKEGAEDTVLINFSGQDIPLSPVVTNLGVKIDAHVNL